MTRASSPTPLGRARWSAARGRFLVAVPVIVSPVTLGPRHKTDPRQKNRFCAAWTVASLKRLAEAGAASVTYFEAYGPRGVQDESGVFPVYQVFEWLAEFAGGEVIPCRTAGDAGIEALVLAAGARRRMLVANLTNQARRVRLKAGTDQSLALEPSPWSTSTGLRNEARDQRLNLEPYNNRDVLDRDWIGVT